MQIIAENNVVAKLVSKRKQWIVHTLWLIWCYVSRLAVLWWVFAVKVNFFSFTLLKIVAEAMTEVVIRCCLVRPAEVAFLFPYLTVLCLMYRLHSIEMEKM
jgi:hypothetical protein